MPQVKKFGTFAGVYTPSVLTILGVIMYMRLGWVVGAAGLTIAIAIIVISHVISISTSLSISSIATDKRIRTGGIYYILSRSLGLPMGGAIGYTLFMGTALSISLYIIGFAESFLSIPEISEFLGLPPDVDSYRILGTIVLVLLVVVAFISTSLALKMQFYILAAIALSIVSIIVGAFLNIDAAPAQPLISKAPDAPSLELIFGIFFPAVTGFTAGVAMSGDLHDPKKSIPGGTMLAVATGFVVYIGLAVLFAYFVDRDTLLNNTNFIIDMAAVGALVFAGIWGATLSSALGGILGAPRIMQAIAQDKISWKIFGKGHGPENEPRNALILTFVISEIGILIGELNAIASVVSMFYLASYAFINVAFTLEKWASTDFRPSFKIPTFIGAIGAIAAFIVMFRLDMVAMAMALVIMWGIYFLLRRKEIKLDKGDVWQSVWSSVIRTALHRMDKRDIEERNWQPNIILFSGGTTRRPHLIEFGRALVGRYGLLSNFDLYEVDAEKILFPKHKQKVLPEETIPGIFTRQQSCNNIYQGIEMISRTYGFSGVEPNTVLMGWGRTAKNPTRFVSMLQNLSELDLNILMLDYDRNAGFGDYKLIDIWWRGHGRHGNLALSLTRFIWSSSEWRDAKMRLMIVNPSNANSDKIYREAFEVVETMRINAEIKVINNEIEQKPFYDIVRSESKETDLIILGVPDIPQGTEKSFVTSTSELMKDLGTVLLIKASSLFKALNFGAAVAKKQAEIFEEITEEEQATFAIDRDFLPKNVELANAIVNLSSELELIVHNLYTEDFKPIFSEHKALFAELKKLTEDTFIRIEKRIVEMKPDQQEKALRRLQNSFLLKARKLFNNYIEDSLEELLSQITEVTAGFLNQIDEIFAKLPEGIEESYSLDDLERATKLKQGWRLWWFVQINQIRVQISGHPAEYEIKFKQLAEQHLPQKLYATVYESLHKFGMVNLEMYIHYMRVMRSIRNMLLLFERSSTGSALDVASIIIEKRTVSDEFVRIEQMLNSMTNRMPINTQLGIADGVRSLSLKLQHTHPNRQKVARKSLKQQLQMRMQLANIPKTWFRNQNLLYGVGRIELMMISFDSLIHNSLLKLENEILNIYNQIVLKKLEEQFAYINLLSDTYDKQRSVQVDQSRVDFSAVNESLWMNMKTFSEATIKEIKYAIDKFPRKIDIISDHSFNNFHKDQFEGVSIVEVSVYRLLHFIVDERVSSPLQSFMQRLPDKLRRTINKATDIMRFISYNLQNEEAEVTLETSGIGALLKEQAKKMELLIEKTTEEKGQASDRINTIITDVSSQLTIYTFSKASENLKQYVKSREGKSRLHGVQKFFNKQTKTVSRFFNQLWFRKSEAMLLAQNLQAEKVPNTAVNELLNLSEKVSPKPDVFTKLPFYYQQLFLRTTDNNEFWHGREKEIKAAQQAIQRFKNGYSGGILIVGERYSGKTSLGNYLGNMYSSEKNVYRITPPKKGSLSLDEFHRTLENTLMFRGGDQQLFGSLPPESVVFFDDLELWWEKSEDGMQVIHAIMDIVERYSGQVLFVVAMNRYTFRLLSRISNIGNYFLSLIECSPFTARQLYDIILQRHRSTGLMLQFRKKEEQQISNFEFANLFTKFFSISKGNIGLALQAWIANIIEVEENKLHLRTPEEPSGAALDEMDKNNFITLLQFVLHKRLTIDRLVRIMFEPREKIEKRVAYLKRSGIIQENANGTLNINRYVHPLVVEKLIDRELL